MSMCEREIDWLPLARPQLGAWPTYNPGMCPTENQTRDPSVRKAALSPLRHTSHGNFILKSPHRTPISCHTLKELQSAVPSKYCQKKVYLYVLL